MLDLLKKLCSFCIYLHDHNKGSIILMIIITIIARANSETRIGKYDWLLVS